MRRIILFFIFISVFSTLCVGQQSVARQWNEAMLSAIREDLARPPVQARNLFHVSMAMYDAWAVYDAVAKTYLLGKTVGGIYYPFTGIASVAPANLQSYRNKAISFAAYRVLVQRYALSPNATASLNRFDALMLSLGYDKNYTSSNYANNDPADLGNYIAQKVIDMGFADGARQAQNYQYVDYLPVNSTLQISNSSNPVMQNPNRWQPLTIVTAFDQNGIPVPSLQKFICPEWGRVLPFAMPLSSAVHYTRLGADYPVYYDPGAPPMLDTVNVANQSSQDFKWGHTMVAAWSSHLDPNDGVMWDISPKAMGNITTYPTTLAGQHSFYNFANGGDIGTGYTVNPVTGMPYTAQFVKRGEYTRMVSQYWADGPSSETPPGHWFVLLNNVGDYSGFQKKYEGVGSVLSNLEWDIKTYFTLGGAVHDAAIACWGIKGWYDTPRPVSAIRKMALYGQCSNNLLPSYHPAGLPLMPGFVELVLAGDPLAGVGNINVNKIKIKAWRGFSFITNPYVDVAGVDWILAENWMPYQRSTFVTPPFAGYLSGHSTYSRAGAQTLTMLTGSPYFPGGLAEYVIPANSFFTGFEAGPSTDIILQWASYKDASDQASLSRIWGGIHPPFDDIPGRLIGEQVGTAAHNKAKTYFTGTVLPVDLLFFSAKEKQCSVELSWATASEQSSKSFTILRSEDGINFNTKIAEVKAAGNSSTIQSYVINDNNPLAKNYYRLVQTDMDGATKQYSIKYVALRNCDAQGDYVGNIYPNPVQDNIHFVIKNASKNEMATVVVSNVVGSVMISKNVTLQTGTNNVNIAVEGLAKGNYFVKIILSNGKIVVQKVQKLEP
jgi:Secretion system C-terminal sorting domain